MALLGRNSQGYAMPPLEWRKVCVLFITAMMLKIVLIVQYFLRNVVINKLLHMFNNKIGYYLSRIVIE